MSRPAPSAFTFDMPEMADGLNFVALSMGVLAGRDPAQPGARAYPQRHGQARQRPDALEGRFQARHRAGAARHRAGLGARHPARRRRHAGPSPPTAWKRRSRPTAPSSARAPSKAAAPEAANNAGAQTSFIPMLTPGHPVEPGDGADDRGDDHPGSITPAPTSSPTSRNCSGA